MVSLGEKVEVVKTLSPNDLGETGSHQSGILLPKESSEVIDFFPPLDSSKKNPRNKIEFTDFNGKHWFFNIIFYNNKFFGGTRNEFRLTCMTPFFKFYGLKSGDEVLFSKKLNGDQLLYSIAISKAKERQLENTIRLRLSNNWSLVTLNHRRGIK
jgi:hypothetical protein